MVGEREPLLALPCNMAFLSRAFQLDFMGEEGSQDPALTANPFPKCPGMEGGGGEAGRGMAGPWGKEMLGEGNQMNYSPGFRSRVGLGLLVLKTSHLAGVINTWCWGSEREILFCLETENFWKF